MNTTIPAWITRDLDKWDARAMALASIVSTWSKDPDRKVGAVVVTSDFRRFSVGYNGFPRSIDDSEGRLKDTGFRLSLTVHAELNALLNADFKLDGCAMYVANNFPCHECAKAIIQAGIVRVVCGRRPDPEHRTWGKSWDLAIGLLDEAKVVWVVSETPEVLDAVRS